MPTDKHFKVINDSIETMISIHEDGKILNMRRAYLATVHSNKIANAILDFDGDLLKVICECDLFRDIFSNLQGKDTGNLHLKKEYPDILMSIDNERLVSLWGNLFSLLKEFHPSLSKLFRRQEFHKFILVSQHVRREFVHALYEIAYKMKVEYQSIFYHEATKKIEPSANSDVMTNVLEFLV